MVYGRQDLGHILNLGKVCIKWNKTKSVVDNGLKSSCDIQEL